MAINIERLETKRLALQQKLDAGKDHAERNRMGQFATPTALAREIVRTAVDMLPENQPIKFLDPAIGTGAFWSSLLDVVPQDRIQSAIGYEVDDHYALDSIKLWEKTKLDYRLQDFNEAKLDVKCNLLICNPPYIRATRISKTKKITLWQETAPVLNVASGRNSGMYSHFMWLAHKWMEPNGVAAWLIPSEFMATRYGWSMKQYLLKKVTLLKTYRFDPMDTQFADANITSVVLWLRNTPCKGNHEDHSVSFGFGGHLDAPRKTVSITKKDLLEEANWARYPIKLRIRDKVDNLDKRDYIEGYFKINHGHNFRHMRHLVLSVDQIEEKDLPLEMFWPILPKPKYLTSDIIDADADGDPQLARQPFVFSQIASADHLAKEYPKVAAYLEWVKKIDKIGATVDTDTRKPWYAQIPRPNPPTRIICTHFGRLNPRQGRPPRFLLNRSRAIISYPYLEVKPTSQLQKLMDEDPSLVDRIFEILQSIPRKVFLHECHLLGGGLCKVEPYDLYRMKVPELRELLPTANDSFARFMRKFVKR